MEEGRGGGRRAGERREAVRDSAHTGLGDDSLLALKMEEQVRLENEEDLQGNLDNK